MEITISKSLPLTTSDLSSFLTHSPQILRPYWGLWSLYLSRFPITASCLLFHPVWPNPTVAMIHFQVVQVPLSSHPSNMYETEKSNQSLKLSSYSTSTKIGATIHLWSPVSELKLMYAQKSLCFFWLVSIPFPKASAESFLHSYQILIISSFSDRTLPPDCLKGIEMFKWNFSQIPVCLHLWTHYTCSYFSF